MLILIKRSLIEQCHPSKFNNFKKCKVAILISDKVEIRARKIVRNKEGPHTMTKGSILQNTFIVYASKCASKIDRSE